MEKILIIDNFVAIQTCYLSKAMKRLWIISEPFPPDETSTGYIMGEIANTFASKYSVSVICGPEIYDKRKKLDLNNQFILDKSICVYRAKSLGLDKNTIAGKICSFGVMTWQMISLARKYICEDDKVLLVTNPATILPFMAWLKKKKGFELNVLVHDVFPENTIPANLKIPCYRLLKHIFDKAYSQADQLIVLGRDMKKVLGDKTSKYNPELKINIIENWADINAIKPQPFPQGRIKIEYAGNIGRLQSLDKFMEHLPESIEFHIYGTGAMESALRKRKQANVYFHGPYYRSQQNSILGDCHLALVILQNGMYGLGVPSKTYNILASGRPIIFIGPKDSEIDLLVKENGIGYSGLPSKWDNISALEEMGQRARRLAETRYSKEIILKKIKNAL